MPRRELQKGPGRVRHGYIHAKESDREYLEKLGIKLGPYEKNTETFIGCVASPDALFKLEMNGQSGSRFIWYFR